MLTRTFEWLDAHPGSYWMLAVPATALFFAYVHRAARRPAASRLTGFFDFLVVFGLLLAWRWPFLLSAEEYNPDESQFIAGAITLAHDPVFFRSVDGTTSGPLNFYALLAFHGLGLPLDYFTARLLAVLLNAGALFLCLRTIAARFGAAVGWLAILPGTALFATAWQGEFIHYSSELVPVLLLSLAVRFLGVRDRGDRARLWLGCVFAGLAPWAKLQSVPLAVTLGCWALWMAWDESPPHARSRTRAVAATIAACLVPTVLGLILLVLGGQIEAAWSRYILQNLVYVESGRPIPVALAMMFGFAREDWRMPLFLGTVSVSAVVLLVALAWRRRRAPALVWVGLALTAAAVFALVTPRREILHYTIFLVTPLTLLLGGAVGAWWSALESRGRLVLSAALVAFAVAPVFVTRLLQPVPRMYGEFESHWRHPRRPTSEVVHALGAQQGPLAIWGYAQWLWVETGLPQATRDALNYRSIEPDPMQAHFREVYLADLRRNRPVVFVDVVGTDGYLYQDRARHAHEIFPALAAEIAAHYTLVRDTARARIYVRNDHAAEAARLDFAALERRGRIPSHVQPPLSATEGTGWRKVGSEDVFLLHPPAEATWELPADTRAIELGFGLAPESYERGETDGADITVVVQEPDELVVFHRALRPREDPADRGLARARIVLPPFASGARLVIRTGVGARGNGAWDWLFLHHLKLRRSPRFLPEQFPGYNRVPESIEAPRRALVGTGANRELVLHTPAALRFRLDGTERDLGFVFGIDPGAYTDGGRTDGAVFRVTLLRDGAEPRTVFTRHLRPGEVTADRGPQRAFVPLGGHQRGDLLELVLDPGPDGNAAWDWTYLRQVRFR